MSGWVQIRLNPTVGAVQQTESRKRERQENKDFGLIPGSTGKLNFLLAPELSLRLFTLQSFKRLLDCKDWPGKKVTILKSRLLMVKSSEMILFSYLHFTSLYGHKIIKEFLRNIHFWKYDNCFSSEVSKLTLVRNKLNLLLKCVFMKVKDVYRICYGPKY